MRATFVRNARASVLLGMWVHVCWNCGVYKEHWALICFSDICVFTCYFICGYTLTIPPPHAHAPPLLPSGPTSPCPLPQATSIRGELPLWTMGARLQHLRFGRGSADSVCLRGRRYLTPKQ